MNRPVFLMLFLCLSMGTAWGHNHEIEQKLREVDATLEEKANYDASKEERINRLRGDLRDAVDESSRWEATFHLYEEYASYKYDSAYNYALALGEMAANSPIQDLVAEAELAKVICLINAGLFKEAFDTASTISEDRLSSRARLSYYRTMVRLNYSARGYAQTEPYWDQYSQAGEYYSRKVLETVPENSRIWHEYNANFLMENRQFEEGVEEFAALLESPGLDLHSRAIYASSMGWMLQILGREEEALLAICESAICDIKSSTKETTALRMLAEYLSRRGEVERPTRYVRASFDDANFYNARLRKLEVGAVLPLVEKNHYDSLSRQHKLMGISIILTVIIAVAAVVSLWFFRRQNRRLHEPTPAWRKPMPSRRNTSATRSISIPNSLKRCPSYTSWWIACWLRASTMNFGVPSKNLRWTRKGTACMSPSTTPSSRYSPHSSTTTTPCSLKRSRFFPHMG